MIKRVIWSHHGESDEFHSLSGVAHFSVEGVDAVVPVWGVAFAPLCADEVLEGAVEAGHLEQTTPPHVALGRATPVAITHSCSVVVVAL